jgi:twitching motility protein PilT
VRNQAGQEVFVAQIDALLRMLVMKDGDDLELVAERTPLFTRRGEPLQITFPALSVEMHADLIAELLTDEAQAILADGGTVQLEHVLPSHGPFRVRLHGARGRVARFSMVEAEQVEAPELDVADVAAADVATPEEAGVGPALRRLLDAAIEVGASDLHLGPGEHPVVRVDGRLERIAGARPANTERLLASLLTVDHRETLAQGGSVDMALALGGTTRLRVNLYRVDGGLVGAFRLLRSRAPDLDSLGLPVSLHELTELSHGLVLLTGATGAGKSTTLAALAQAALDRRAGVLLTLEDPIEYTFVADGHGSLVRQREVGRHVRSFGSGLRDALREDPDIILIGEMRDLESISLAITAAETGHLVLASLHCRSAYNAVERMVDVYPAERQSQVRVQLADALRAVVAQRLLPRANGRGRVPALEILRNTTAVSALIRDGRPAQLVSAIQSGAADGMILLEKCLRDMVRKGIITTAQAMAACNSPAQMQAYMSAR